MFINDPYSDGQDRQDRLRLVCMNKQAVLSDGGTALPTTVSGANRASGEREPAAASRPRGALALVGAWGTVADEDIDALIADIYSRRAGASGRRVELAD